MDTRAGYLAGVYRVSKWLEIGAFRSLYVPDYRQDTKPATNHQYDTAVSARINFHNNWYAKVEGHFFDGAPTVASAARGFYAAANPGGVAPTTNLLVIRTGVSF